MDATSIIFFLQIKYFHLLVFIYSDLQISATEIMEEIVKIKHFQARNRSRSKSSPDAILTVRQLAIAVLEENTFPRTEIN